MLPCRLPSVELRPARRIPGHSLSRRVDDRRRQIEYGDFQTPPELADAVCRVLAAERPASIIEPTCGTGAFLGAALQRFPSAKFAIGFDLNPRYVSAARRRLAEIPVNAECTLRTDDFFRTDWSALVGGAQIRS